MLGLSYLCQYQVEKIDLGVILYVLEDADLIGDIFRSVQLLGRVENPVNFRKLLGTDESV